MKQVSVGIFRILIVVCLFSGVSALSQTVTCPTKLLVAGTGFNTSNSFGPGTAGVQVSGSQMICSYGLETEWSVKAASGSACSSIHIELKASLPNPFSPALPGGFSVWKFNRSTAQLSFYEYANGACKYGLGSSPNVTLQSEIPSGYTCSTGPSGTSTFICVSPDSRGQLCNPGQYPNFTANEDQYACVACTGNTFSNGTQRQCQTCAPGSVADAAHNNCNACSGNQVSQGTSCKSCPPGGPPNSDHSACLPQSCPQGQGFNSSHLCENCTGNTFSAGGKTAQCTPCGTVPNSNHSACLPPVACPASATESDLANWSANCVWSYQASWTGSSTVWVPPSVINSDLINFKNVPIGSLLKTPTIPSLPADNSKMNCAYSSINNYTGPSAFNYVFQCSSTTGCK